MDASRETTPQETPSSTLHDESPTPPTNKTLVRPVRALLAVAGLVSAGAGIVGMIVPVLPTTPFLLLAAFLFARSSSRLARWLQTTRAYQTYVVPFQSKRGMPVKTKRRIIVVSYAAMAVSAFLVRDTSVAPVAWALLAAVACWLLWFVALRTPTISEHQTNRDAA